MPVAGSVPEIVLTIVAAATIFTVMFGLGLGIVLGEFRWIAERPGLVARGLFCVLVAVPAAALAVTRLLDLPRWVEIGIVLMAISPGAPLALQRSLGAGGHRAFAPALQILVAILAVLSMPLSIAALDEVYAGHASISPLALARQVFTAQLLPLGLGVLVRRVFPVAAERVHPYVTRIGNVLLVVLVILALIEVRDVVIGAGVRLAFAVFSVTVIALAIGHVLGGPAPATRTAVAISSAARNPGLALLVATLNHAPPDVARTVLAYLVVSALTVLPYAIWRNRAGGSTLRTET